MFNSNLPRTVWLAAIVVFAGGVLPAAVRADSVHRRAETPAAVCVSVADRDGVGRSAEASIIARAVYDDHLSPFLDDEPRIAAGRPSPDIACKPAVYDLLGRGSGRWWAGADYLLLWTNGNRVPPLVTTNATVPPRQDAGVLGR